MIPYTLVRSKRRTISLQITRDAIVEIRAPINASKAEIDQMITKHQKWIERNLAECKEKAELRETFSLSYGSKLLFQGTEYPIVARNGNTAEFDGKNLYLPPDLSPEEIRQIVIQIYKKQAKNILSKYVAEYSNIMKCFPTGVGITNAKTRWGSCSRRGRINFSWYLIMADFEEIEYVVIHELAHIKEHNHSQRFWDLVAQQIPDYKERRKKLSELQQRLAVENW